MHAISGTVSSFYHHSSITQCVVHSAFTTTTQIGGIGLGLYCRTNLAECVLGAANVSAGGQIGGQKGMLLFCKVSVLDQYGYQAAMTNQQVQMERRVSGCNWAGGKKISIYGCPHLFVGRCKGSSANKTIAYAPSVVN